MEHSRGMISLDAEKTNPLDEKMMKYLRSTRIFRALATKLGREKAEKILSRRAN